MKPDCTLPELEAMLKRGSLQSCTHICRVHGVHIAKDGKVITTKDDHDQIQNR